MYRKKDIEKMIWVLLLWPIILLLVILKIFPNKKKFKKKNYLSKEIEDLTPYEFEHYIAQIFNKKGYKTKVTSLSRDYGVDIIAKNKTETIAIQVKKYNKTSVGNKDVQRLLGAMQMNKIKANRSILITTSWFTKNAYEQARGCQIELWGGKKLSKVISKSNISTPCHPIKKIVNHLR